MTNTIKKTKQVLISNLTIQYKEWIKELNDCPQSVKDTTFFKNHLREIKTRLRKENKDLLKDLT